MDDDPNLLGLLEAVLERDYSVETAQGGSAALELLHGDTPPQVDLVVLDIMMPGMAGWDVLQKIREEPRTRHTPVIMLTGKIDEDSKRRSYELGANMFLTKPYDPETLEASIAVMLSLDAEERAGRALTEGTNLWALQSGVMVGDNPPWGCGGARFRMFRGFALRARYGLSLGTLGRADMSTRADWEEPPDQALESNMSAERYDRLRRMAARA